MLKSIAKSGLGGVGAQVVTLVSIPLLARRFLPNDFAHLALALAGILILGSMSTLRYELAVVIPKQIKEASNLFWIAFLFVLIFSWVGGFFFSTDFGLRLVGLGGLINSSHAAVFFSAGIFLVGSLALLNNWAVRCTRFGLMALAQVALAIVTIGVELFYPVTPGNGFMCLLSGVIFGQATSLFILWCGLWRRGELPSLPNGFRSMVASAQRHKNFPFYSVPMTLCGTLRERAVVVILERYFTIGTIGSYVMVQRLVNFPVGLISSAIRPVLFESVAKNGLSANERRIQAVLCILLLLSAPWLGWVLAAADDLMPLLLGAGWDGAGSLLRILIWPIYTFMFCNWMDRLLDVTGRQRLGLLLEFIFALLSLVALAMAAMLVESLEGALLAQASILVIYNLVYFVTVFRVCGYALMPFLRVIPMGFVLGLMLHQVTVAVSLIVPIVLSMLAGVLVIFAVYAIIWKRLIAEVVHVRHK